ncbi:hypothetical protein JCM10295v2_002924 [Rhodotorula toruloides]
MRQVYEPEDQELNREKGKETQEAAQSLVQLDRHEAPRSTHQSKQESSTSESAKKRNSTTSAREDKSSKETGAKLRSSSARMYGPSDTLSPCPPAAKPATPAPT